MNKSSQVSISALVKSILKLEGESSGIPIGLGLNLIKSQDNGLGAKNWAFKRQLRKKE